MSNTENRYTETDLGNVAPNPRGEYDPAAAYEYLDLVEYGGGSYLCVQEAGTVTGIAPAQGKNTEVWQVLTIPGDLTAEYIAMHDDVVNKAESAQTDAASTAADREQVESMLANVEQLHTQTETAAQEASDSRDSAAGYAAAAEASRTAAADSEKNAQLQVAGFNETVNAAKQEATEEITTARKTAVQAVAAQQVKSVNAVNAAGSAAIEKTSADAKEAKDAKAEAVSAANAAEDSAREATAAAEQAKNNKQSAETAAAAAKTSAAAAETAQKAVEGAAGQIETNTAGIEALKEDLSNKITKFYASNQGETHITDSDNGKIQDMMIYGKSSQDGTPTPDNSVEIKSVVNPKVEVLDENGTESQIVIIPYTLDAIPVSSGGNVTINGQQYIADYVDVEKGKLYRKVKRLNLKDVDAVSIAHGFHSNGNGYLSFSVENINKEQQLISNRYRSSTWTQTSGYMYTPNSNSIVFVDDKFTDRQTAIKIVQDTYVIYALSTPTEENLSLEQIKFLKSLSTHYPVTKITVGSEELNGYAVFNYPVSMANGWNYVKQQLNDNRNYIYDMDLQSAEAYVNSEYAVALTELEV